MQDTSDIPVDTTKHMKNKRVREEMDLKCKRSKIVGEELTEILPTQQSIGEEVDSENVYIKRPDFLSDDQISEYFSSINDSSVVYDVDGLKRATYSFRKACNEGVNFTQFTYDHAPKLCVATTAYGICVSNSENFTEKTVLPSIDSLEPKHRVAIMLPCVNHWWHPQSKQLVQAYLKRFVDDIKCIPNGAVVKQAKRFNLDVQQEIQSKIRNRIDLGTKTQNGVLVPALFGIKIFTSGAGPSKIRIPFASIDADTRQLRGQKWKSLITPKYLATIMVISVNGFKFTRAGLSIDMNVESLIGNIIERPRIERSTYFSKGYTFVPAADDSDDEQERNSSKDDWHY